MSPDIQIQKFDAKYRQAFYDLNIAWLEKYFTVEPAHRQMLENPEAELLEGGGEVFFAVSSGDVVGTVGVRNAGGGVFELTKLAVDPKAQSGGVGRKLCDAVIAYFMKAGGKTLYLETHNSLKPALHLYKDLGFKLTKNPGEKHYDGCDLYMEWQAPQ
ncbi:MAG: GNAT family N-acetyltransferase [Kordiimonadaceae bacterium]|nr:GNAT family N-acetyltransferase [Kordiimonadaceae bacterium]MBO6568006.1 GNAT family N-acetyltransferase [Kordiimonadaceae bacterium]MBO6964264.1 GNAT family N-acetyltransferase [Kordiimonadaceae bacterium]